MARGNYFELCIIGGMIKAGGNTSVYINPPSTPRLVLEWALKDGIAMKIC
jgi:hypothetical protein